MRPKADNLSEPGSSFKNWSDYTTYTGAWHRVKYHKWELLLVLIIWIDVQELVTLKTSKVSSPNSLFTSRHLLVFSPKITFYCVSYRKLHQPQHYSQLGSGDSLLWGAAPCIIECLSLLPDLYPLDIPKAVTTETLSRHCSMSPRGQKCPSSKITGLELPTDGNSQKLGRQPHRRTKFYSHTYLVLPTLPCSIIHWYP